MFSQVSFLLAAALLILLAGECWFRRKQPWALPAAFVYGTILGWYFVDLFISPEEYQYIPSDLLGASYLQVTAFLLSYRLILPWITRRLTKGARQRLTGRGVSRPDTLLVGAMILWLILLSWGVIRMNGQILDSMFPINARAGGNMWSREAAGDAGGLAFIVSAASYLFVLVSASFGILFFFVPSKGFRYLAVVLMLISWPYFLLSGTRSTFLAVCVPFFVTYLLFSVRSRAVKAAALIMAFLAVNTVLLVIISFRGVGLEEYLNAQEAGQVDELNMRHQGLNMIQELCFVNAFAPFGESGYGTRYLAELLNIVPRAIWPEKPMLGIDYAVWRGFSGGDSDTGVVATVSTGLIGGGVLNFGPVFGPVAPAVFMALWSGLLARWWIQRDSILRCLLFLAGLGVTFNLGRDLTLLVLWPIVFACGITMVIERSSRTLIGTPKQPGHQGPADVAAEGNR